MSQPPPDGKVSGWLNAVRGLTLTNVLVIALLVPVLSVAYLVYKALNDEKILDRLMSTYEERPDQSGCLLRHVKERAGPDQWGISSGFAIQGNDKWFVTVIMSHPPTPEEVVSYCESLKLITDQMRADRGHRDDAPAQ